MARAYLASRLTSKQVYLNRPNLENKDVIKSIHRVGRKYQIADLQMISLEASCKIGIGLPLKELQLKICIEWIHFAVRFERWNKPLW